jgi:hypothetical protein
MHRVAHVTSASTELGDNALETRLQLVDSNLIVTNTLKIAPISAATQDPNLEHQH